MKDFLHHLFLPHVSNNYRARLLHHKSMLTIIVVLFFASFSLSAIRTTFPSVLGTFSNITAQQLLLLTNQDRQQYGLPPLVLNQDLSQAALNKANNMFAQNYWAHDSPDGKTPWDFIKASGYNYTYAGENLARGFTTAQSVVNAWMASPEHRQNMLSSNYTSVGFAVESGDLTGENTVLVVEMLGSTALAAAPGNELAAKTQETKSTTTTVQNSPQPTPQQVLNANKTPTTTKFVPITKPLIDSASLSKNIATLIVALFIFTLILDMVVIERKRVVRLVGHNMDHLFFLSMLLILIGLIAKGATI